MLDLLSFVILGIIQGVTEFLPISSSGHLVIAQKLLGTQTPDIWLEVCLHLGTLVAIILVFKKKVSLLVRDSARGVSELVTLSSPAEVKRKAPYFPLVCMIVIATVPVVVAGLLFHNQIQHAFEGNIVFVGIMLCVTGLVLLVGRFALPGRYDKVTPRRGFLIGLAQVVALLPGISRSGITITAGSFAGMTQKRAAEFSFLLAIPAIAGAMTLQLVRLVGGDIAPPALESLLCLVIGTGVSATVGWLSLKFLLNIIQKGRLHWFGYYCLPAGILIILLGT